MTAPAIRLPNGWKPRFYQDPLWRYLTLGGKRALEVGHRRWGKDDISLHHTACAAHERAGNYVHMLPEAAQARKAIWTAVNPHTGIKRIDEAFPAPLRKRTHDNEMFIEFECGSTWQVAGSDNYNSIVGTSFAGMVFSEFALANPSAWAYFAPILLENNGWALFITTPRGKNHVYAMLQSARKDQAWFTQVSTVDDTGIFSKEELQAELQMLMDMHGEDYGRAVWRQEYWCSFDAAIPGAIWADCIIKLEDRGRILDFDIDKSIAVETGWDLGRTDDTAIWFTQSKPKELDVIGHHSSSLKDIPFYVQVLLQFMQAHGVRYTTHWLPHDARPRTLAAGGKSILQQFTDAANNLRAGKPAFDGWPMPEAPIDIGEFCIAPRLDKQEGIQAGRRTFPYCRFHKSNTEKGLESLRHYHREWDDEKKAFSNEPKHDWSSHDADGWRTRAVTYTLPDQPETEASAHEKLLAGNPTKQRMGVLTKRHFEQKKRERSSSGWT